jgi:hypothetical protein
LAYVRESASWRVPSWLLALALCSGTAACVQDANPEPDDLDASAADGGMVAEDAALAEDAAAAGTCEALTCSLDQHCEAFPRARCVPNSCGALICGRTQKCVTTTSGAHCEDNGCHDDGDCAPKDYCEDMRCVPDVCEAESRSCDADSLVSCAANGGARLELVTCGGDNDYFASACVVASPSQAGCTCQDDWDCPEHTACEAGTCLGGGDAPGCTLPVLSVATMSPVPEITWGGISAADSAARVASLEPLSPPVAGARPLSIWPTFSQVLHTPIVINLDDDNGDGKFDDRDFPEIVFLAFADHDFTSNAIVRAIHGGGPAKGKDYFATCGAVTWQEGDAQGAACTSPDLDSTASIAAGDLDNDGKPEIVAVGEDDTLHVYDSKGRRVLAGAAFSDVGANPAITLANLDGAGFAEIVVGHHVHTLTHDSAGNLAFADRFSGAGPSGTSNGQGPVSCVANLLGGSRPELVDGAIAYRVPVAPAGAKRMSDCAANGGSVTPTTSEERDFCNGALTVVWDAAVVNGLSGDAVRGLCAVADVLGAEPALPPGPASPLDGKPEVITVENEDLRIWSGQTGELLRTLDLGTGEDGGPPSVGDFDGDGFPELGVALATTYVVVDLQAATSGGECDAWPVTQTDDGMSVAAANVARTPPAASCSSDTACGDTNKFACNETLGECVCLHNGWRRQTEDDASRVTGASVFDFEGDGAAELVYNDECSLRMYGGANGDVLFEQASESRTRSEYPVVADVDNDGNAELVFGTSNESGACSEALASHYNNGLEVWGDAHDAWVSARRIWNQHGYHVSNVTEAGAIPRVEPESWQRYQGRTYNTYRGSVQANGWAPDLAPTAIEVSPHGDGCAVLGDTIDITVQIENRGALRAGPGAVVSLFGTWGTHELPLRDANGDRLTTRIMQSLEPGDRVRLTVPYDAANDVAGELPKGLRVLVDDGDRERECVEDNNDLIAQVASETRAADLTIEVKKPDGCPVPRVDVVLCNRGSIAADGVTARLFAGNPDTGGLALADVSHKGTLAPDKCSTQTATLTGFPANRDIQVYGVVDPLDEIAECASKNNVDAAPALACRR